MGVRCACLFITFISFQLAVGNDINSAADCPAHCRCQNTTVSCTGGRLSVLIRIPKYVTKLILLDCGLTTIETDQFKATPRLDHLTIRQNNLSMIQENAFRGLDRLEVLLLDSNNLVHISPRAFAGLASIVRISLSDNYLTWAELNATFNDLPSVEFINLRQNNLNSTELLPSGFGQLDHLSSLQLGLNNDIENITENYFAAAISVPIEYVDLSYCPLSYIHPDSFLNLPHITELDVSYSTLTTDNMYNIFLGLSNSSITALHIAYVLQSHEGDNHMTPDVFEPLHSTDLRYLDLQGNYAGFRRHGLSAHFFRHVRHLRELYLDNCQINWLAKEALRGLHKLRKLSLRQNYISCLTGCPFLSDGPQLKNLHHLDFSDNVISNNHRRSLQFRQEVFPKLRTLILMNNRIQSIQRGMFNELSTLKMLDLSQNPISSIDASSFESLHSLQTLFIRGSLHLTVLVNGTFRGLRKLTHLNLNNNQLQVIQPKALRGLHNLQVLELNGNRVGGTGLPETYLQLDGTMLRKLDIGNNRFELLPTGIVDQNRNLKVLVMHYNRVSQIDRGSFHMLRLLETLDLSYNDIINFDDTSFRELNKLKSLNLAGNPFLCTCKLKPFVDWLRADHVRLTESHAHRCIGPLDQRGQPLITYTPTTWDCQVRSIVVPIASAMTVLLVGGLLAILSCRVFCCRDAEGSSVSIDSNENRRTLSWLRELLPVNNSAPPVDDTIETEQVCTDLEDPLLVESQTTLNEPIA